jgi:hypothetical protein
MGRVEKGDWRINLEAGARHTLVPRAWRGDGGEESSMTGTSVEEDRMVAERLPVEQLMDLPDISCVTG